MTRNVAIVFARVPRLGTVKRRLAAELGDRAALRFHATTLHALLRRCAADRRFRTVLAATPRHARMPMPHRIDRMTQGHGDLGQRMARLFRAFPHRRVALIGCDIPQAGAADLVAAFRSLGSAAATFGPAADGGYWLVGMAPGRRPARPFAAVRWSSPHALADTERNFPGRKIARLRMLDDVDTAADFQKWRGTQRSPAPHGPPRAG